MLHRFIEVNFSKLTDSNQIFRNDFVCLYKFIITSVKFQFKLISAFFFSLLFPALNSHGIISCDSVARSMAAVLLANVAPKL